MLRAKMIYSISESFTDGLIKTYYNYVYKCSIGIAIFVRYTNGKSEGNKLH